MILEIAKCNPRSRCLSRTGLTSLSALRDACACRQLLDQHGFARRLLRANGFFSTHQVAAQLGNAAICQKRPMNIDAIGT